MCGTDQGSTRQGRQQSGPMWSTGTAEARTEGLGGQPSAARRADGWVSPARACVQQHMGVARGGPSAEGMRRCRRMQWMGSLRQCTTSCAFPWHGEWAERGGRAAQWGGGRWWCVSWAHQPFLSAVATLIGVTPYGGACVFDLQLRLPVARPCSSTAPVSLHVQIKYRKS